ncbi:MAG: hypothetical protein U0Y82_11170 [Thermoleophilia bacterium]
MDTGSALAVVAVVIALASAILTWQVGRRTLRITTYSGATELTLAIGEKMIANPELRQYFYDRRPLQPEVTGRDRSLVLATGMYILDVLECIWDHRREYERDDRESWGRYIHDCLQAPVLRDLYEECSADGWYPALDHLIGTAGEEVVRSRGRLWLMRTPRPPRRPRERNLASAGGYRLVWADHRPRPLGRRGDAG